MALNLFARSLSWGGRTLRQAVRPIGIVHFDAGCHLGSEGNGTNSMQDPGSSGRFLSPRPPSECIGVCRPAAFSVAVPAYTFATMAAKQGVGVEAQESEVAREKRNQASKELRDGWGAQEGSERLGPQRPKSAKEARHQWVSITQAFYQRLKGWPVDVDLHEKLKDSKVFGVKINERLVRSILHLLGNRGSRHSVIRFPFWKSGESSLAMKDLRSTDDDIECSLDDGLRALNIFNWQQSQNTETPQLMLLNPLFKVLCRARMDNELRVIWNTYKVHATHDRFLVADACKAFFDRGLYEEALAVHSEALKNNWAVLPRGHDYAVQAMHAKHAHPKQIWMLYKRAVQSTGWGLLEPGYVILLKAGVSIEPILSLKHRDIDRLLARLIDALSLLERRDEAAVVVDRLLKRKKAIKVEIYVRILMVLIRNNFKDEAQMLAKVQNEKHGVSLDAALIYTTSRELEWVGVKANELLSTLEGPHRTSISVQAALIIRCFYPLKLVDKMWEAYQLGKQFEGTFSPEVVRYMLYALTRADRIPHVEEVLADYYRSLDASALSHSMTVIGESVFHCLFEMYIRAGQSDKVVEMFKEMVMRKLHIRPYFSLAWYKRLRKHGYHKEAEQLKALSVKRRRSNKVQLKSVYKY